MEFTDEQLALLRYALEEIIPWLEEDDNEDFEAIWQKLGFNDGKGII